MQDISLKLGNAKFTVRAAGLAFNGGKVLLCNFSSPDQETFWFVPGGKVNLLESASSAVQREYQEELGEPVRCGRLIWLTESIVNSAEPYSHEIALYFEVEIDHASKLLSSADVIPGIEKGSNISFKWVSAEEARTLNILPGFVKRSIVSSNYEFKHLVRLNEM